MAIYFCILGIYNMANDLKHISHILQEVWKDLKELNDKYNASKGDEKVATKEEEKK